MNNAENSHDLPVEQKSQVIDRLSNPGVEGRANGESRGGREQERESEAFLWTAIPDYHREFDRLLIDPPHAAVAWRVTGHMGDDPIDLAGSTIFEFDESDRISRFWLHFNEPNG